MRTITRIAATGSTVLAMSAVLAPAAGAVTSDYYGGSGSIRVCLQLSGDGDEDGGAEVGVRGRSVNLDDGDCATFRGLSRSRVYRVTADPDRGCRIDNDERYVRPSRYRTPVTFYGRCFGGGGWHGDDDDQGGGHQGGGHHGGGWNGGGPQATR